MQRTSTRPRSMFSHAYGSADKLPRPEVAAGSSRHFRPPRPPMQIYMAKVGRGWGAGEKSGPAMQALDSLLFWASGHLLGAREHRGTSGGASVVSWWALVLFVLHFPRAIRECPEALLAELSALRGGELNTTAVAFVIWWIACKDESKAKTGDETQGATRGGCVECWWCVRTVSRIHVFSTDGY